MSSETNVSALMKDIVRYERTIGELLDRNEMLAAEVERRKSEQEAWFNNKQDNIGSDLVSLTNVVLRLAEQQGRQFDMVYRLITQGLLNNGQTVDSTLLEAFGDSAAFTSTLTRVITGRTVDKLAELKIDLGEERAVRALRGKAVLDDEIAGLGKVALILDEDIQKGVHSLVVPVDQVTATGVRGVVLEMLPRELSAIRIRLRQKDNWANYSEVNVDLKHLRHAHFQTSFTIGRRDVVMRQLSNGWVRVFFETGLEISESGVEVELIAMANADRKSSHRKGKGKPAFAVRQCKILYSQGLTGAEADESVLEDLKDAGAVTPSVVQVEVKSPGQERQRREKRDAYLASGAYKRLTRFRNKHQGKRAFIIGNGPSINNQDLTLLKDEVTFVTNWFINHPQYKEIDPTYFCVSSHEMFGGWGTPDPKANQDWLEQMLARAQGTHKFFSYPFRDFMLREGVFPEDQCDFLLFDRPKYQIDQKGDINLDLTQPMDDGYTGIITFCLPLCHFMGIKEVYLLGCDCDYGLTSPDAPKSYFYDFSKHTTSTTSYEGLQRVWADDGPIFQTYEIVRKRFLQDDIQIVNCTDGGRLEVFPRARFEDVVANKT